MSGQLLHRTRARFTIDLHPSKAADVRSGVREELNALLIRYNEDLEGVLLSYSNERLCAGQAPIHAYFAYLRMVVEADVVLFKPRAGQLLRGQVHAVGGDYLGLLALGIFNAVVPASAIRADLQRQPGTVCWQSRANPRHRIEVGTEVQFRIHTVAPDVSDFVSISGQLQDADTGAVAFLQQQPRPPAQQQSPPRPQAPVQAAAAPSRPGAGAPLAAPVAPAAAGGHADAQPSGSHRKEKKRKAGELAEATPGGREEKKRRKKDKKAAAGGTPAPAAALPNGHAAGAAAAAGSSQATQPYPQLSALRQPSKPSQLGPQAPGASSGKQAAAGPAIGVGDGRTAATSPAKVGDHKQRKSKKQKERGGQEGSSQGAATPSAAAPAAAASAAAATPSPLAGGLLAAAAAATPAPAVAAVAAPGSKTEKKRKKSKLNTVS